MRQTPHPRLTGPTQHKILFVGNRKHNMGNHKHEKGTSTMQNMETRKHATTPSSLPRRPLEPMRKTNPICGKSKAQLGVQQHKTGALPQHLFGDVRWMRGVVKLEGALGEVILLCSLSLSLSLTLRFSLYTFVYNGRSPGESKT
jgi:hypothetical protein